MPRQKRGAPPGNHNARRHGGYSDQHRQGDAARAKAAGGEAEPASPKDSGPQTLPSLPDLIRDLYRRQQELATWMQDNATCEGQQDGHYISAMSLYGQNASRLARMVRLTQGLGNDKTQKLADTLNEALLSAMSEMGIELT